jgi:hypothetical protein
MNVNTKLFIAQGKLTLGNVLEEAEKQFVDVMEIPPANNNQTKCECVWTWIFTNNLAVKGAFEIKDEEDVRRWAAVAVSLSKHGSRPLYVRALNSLELHVEGLSDNEVTFANHILKILELNFIATSREP